MKKTSGYSKGGSTKKLAKANDGKTVKTSAVDPEGNIVKSKTNQRTGRNVTKITYADPTSSGKKKERIVTPGLTKAQMKANALYASNPKAAKEDSFTPYVAGMRKKGGTIKKMTKSSKKK